MSEETDYCEGRAQLEDGRLIFLDRPASSWKDVAYDFFFAVCIGAFIGVVLASLPGCASVTEEPIAKVCYMRILGHTQEDDAVVLQSCMSPGGVQRGAA